LNRSIDCGGGGAFVGGKRPGGNHRVGVNPRLYDRLKTIPHELLKCRPYHPFAAGDPPPVGRLGHGIDRLI
jgi:hypothetical protein